MEAFLQPLESFEEFRKIREKLKKDKGILQLSGCIESQKTHLIYGLNQRENHALIIAENDLKAKQLYEDYKFYDENVFFYPAKDLLFYQADIHGNLLVRERMQVLKELRENTKLTVIVSIQSCMDAILKPEELEKQILKIKNDSIIEISALEVRLASMGYERVEQVEMPGQFAVRGGIVDIYSLTEENPWRIELWGDEVDAIKMFEVSSQRSIENLVEIRIYPAIDEAKGEGVSFLEYFDQEKSFVFLDEPNRLMESAFVTEDEFEECILKRENIGHIFGIKQVVNKINHYHCAAVCAMEHKMGDWNVKEKYNIVTKSVNSYNNSFELLVKDLKAWKKSGYQVILLSASRTRAQRLSKDLMNQGLNSFYTESCDRAVLPGEILVQYGHAHKGFEYPLLKFLVITETDIFGKEKTRKKKKKEYSGNQIQSFSELNVGDYVVHENHGLGIYRGIEKVEVDHILKDYIKIEYQGKSNLYILATQLDLLQKYASADAKPTALNRLGGSEWRKTTTKVKKEVKNIAKELVELYASRQQHDGYAYGPDTVWQREFEEVFPFEETEDQLLAIEATKRDMESHRIMDRLICGDVGYGKTEIAIRAAFKAVQESKQVVYLVPTTILAQQHYNTFVQRMKDFPIRIDMLCRFRTQAEQKKTLVDLKKGYVDILIGTHRVLSKDVKFKDLGLLIIDEEQRFGVTHKEKIKSLKSNVDVLTLTATPIPRTLHMSLIGIRDMSVLEEPPLDRLPIQTYVMEQNDEIVREAISRELSRGGQVYYVYNRVNDIVEVANHVTSLVPEANVGFAHGQMNERELEKIMYGFINGEIDVLVSTTIIETGLDISNVNTMIIHDSDRLGLSQLYQLRGRVGRSNRTSYAFLMYRKDKMLKEVAEKRLTAIREFTDLGSGFKIAMRDLEIRGAGNLLGAEQHGHMEAIGYDLYCKLLNQAVKEAKGEKNTESFETVIDISINAYIPEKYITNEYQKLDIYKRIAGIENKKEYEDMSDELMDRFGEPPKSVQNLLAIAHLKALAHRVYMTEVKQMTDTIKFTMYENAKINIEGIPKILEKYPEEVQIRQEKNLCFFYKPRRINQKQKIDMMKKAEEFLTEFEAI